MFRIGDTVRIFINDAGYRTGKIVDSGFNSFWVEYNGKKYLVATKFLQQWQEEEQ